MTEHAERLEYLRGQIRAERISWGELNELQGLADHIEPGDVELLEAAGVPEFPNEDAIPPAALVAMAEHPGKTLERCSCGRLKPVGEPCE